jgi:hypothetical protein
MMVDTLGTQALALGHFAQNPLGSGLLPLPSEGVASAQVGSQSSPDSTPFLSAGQP